jgi:CubicO group peptidase (beta-lactamase class C family)
MLERITPEKVGLSSSRLTRIGKVMQRYVDEQKLAGLITMVARRGKIAHFECCGMMSIEDDRPMQPDTIFRIASMTKPVTCVAAMMLYEEGCFQLTDPVSGFIPAFKEVQVLAGASEEGLDVVDAEREVTIRDLLTHTSGLGPDNPERSPAPDEDLEEWVERLVNVPLAHQPGREWRYGWSSDVLGRLVEVISGLSFDAFLEERVFEPLGMHDTGFFVPEHNVNRLAALYGPADDGLLQLIDAPGTSQYSRRRTFLAGGGGLVSTACDYVRFAQMLLSGGELDGIRLLSRKTVEFMTLNHLPSELLPMKMGLNVLEGIGYGLSVGVMMNPARFGTIGSSGMFFWPGVHGTFFWVDPQETLIGLILTQFDPWSYYPAAREMQVLTYQAVVD